MKNDTVPQPATQGQFLDIIATITGAFPKNLTKAEAQRIISAKGRVVWHIREVLREFSQFPGIQVNISIGGETKEELLRKIARTQVKVWATEMIKNRDFQVAPNKTTISLLVATIEDLGFTEKPNFHEVLSRVEKLGYQLCHPEVGPRLWLQDDLKMEAGIYYIVMNPLYGSNRFPEPFYLSFPNGFLGQGPGMEAKLTLEQKIIFAQQ